MLAELILRFVIQDIGMAIFIGLPFAWLLRRTLQLEVDEAIPIALLALCLGLTLLQLTPWPLHQPSGNVFFFHALVLLPVGLVLMWWSRHLPRANAPSNQLVKIEPDVFAVALTDPARAKPLKARSVGSTDSRARRWVLGGVAALGVIAFLDLGVLVPVKAAVLGLLPIPDEAKASAIWSLCQRAYVAEAFAGVRCYHAYTTPRLRIAYP